jgi:Zn finger protein HypA/HybF involved in hydrogenase expression
MKFVCTNCGYESKAEVHLMICPHCKGPMKIVRLLRNLIREILPLAQ